MSELKGIEQAKTPDSAEKPAVQNAGSDNSRHGWLVENVLDPLANGAAIKPWNAIASVADDLTGSKLLPKVEMLSTSQEHSAFNSGVQAVSEGVGSLVPFLISSKIAGSALKGTARFIDGVPALDGAFTSSATSFLASDRTARIAGAALYGAAEDPGQGQSRLGNSLGSAVGFGAFELGGKLSESVPLAQKLGIRLGTGFLGGVGSSALANGLGHGDVGSSSDLLKAGLGGAAMNTLLPAAAEGLNRVSDSVSSSLGRPISAEGYARRAGWSGNNQLQSLIDKNPLTRVKATEEASNIDQRANVVNLNRDAGSSTLAHELEHRTTYKGSADAYKDVAASLDPKSANYSEETAWNKFRAIRLGQEVSSREVQNATARASNQPLETEVDPARVGSLEATPGKSYDQVWRDEFEQFKESGGKTRPQTDYEGQVQPIASYKNNMGEFVREYDPNNPLKTKLGDALRVQTDQAGTYSKLYRPDNSMAYVTTEAHDIVPFEEPLMKKFFPDGIGKSTISEYFNDGDSKFTIESGRFPPGSVLRGFGQPVDSPFGPVRATVSGPNDSFTLYYKEDGTDAIIRSNPAPVEGLEDRGSFHILENKADGDITVHSTNDGKNVLEDYSYSEAGLQTSLNDSPAVYKQSLPGKTIYDFGDGTHSVVEPYGRNLRVTDTLNGQTSTRLVKSVQEQLPNADFSRGRPINARELTPRGLTEITPAGTRITQLAKPIVTPVGDVTEELVYSNNALVHLTADGSPVTLSDKGIATNIGVVNAIKRGNNLVTVARTNVPDGEWKTMEINFDNASATKRDVAGNIMADQTEFFQKGGMEFVENHPEGLLTPDGEVNQLRTTGPDVLYSFTDGHKVSSDQGFY